MAYTQADLDRLDRAIAGNAKSVMIEGKRIDYRDTGDLLKARNVVAQALAAGSGTTLVRQFKIFSRKDL
jgi:hypothetical protein